MKIMLAGYNIDTEILQFIKSQHPEYRGVSPETIAAAYARISRSTLPADQLRKIAREEISKARGSNKRIVFDMGHSSIAEHAFFNFDIGGVSRYAIEFIEQFRLCTYTEKSQRYVKLESDFVIPEELNKNTGLQSDFREMIQLQNALYNRLYAEILAQQPAVKALEKADLQPPKDIEGQAKEDARYITAMAMAGQLGLSLNARNLEYMLKRLQATGLHELIALANCLYQEVKDIAPSLIRYPEPGPYEMQTDSAIKALALELLVPKTARPDNCSSTSVTLLEWPEKGDMLLLAALLHRALSQPFSACLESAQNMAPQTQNEFIQTVFRDIRPFQAVLREFEFPTLMFEAIVSAACFAQLKRHRMLTLTIQPYDPSLGVTIPESIQKGSLAPDFVRVIQSTDRLFEKINRTLPRIAPYILTNAHRRRVLIKVNARELYHLARLRQDVHAQWDIKNIVTQMVEQARTKLPLTLILACGKDQFEQVYQEVFPPGPGV